MPSIAQAARASIWERRGKNGLAESMGPLGQAVCQLHLCKTGNMQKPLVDTANAHFAALQKNILHCGRLVPISARYSGFRCTFLDVSSLNLAVLSGTALFFDLSDPGSGNSIPHAPGSRSGWSCPAARGQSPAGVRSAPHPYKGSAPLRFAAHGSPHAGGHNGG